MVSPLVKKVIDGYNVTILTYGVTGSGKTFTIFGKEGIRGISELSLPKLIKSSKIEIWMSLIEIYNESVNDLISGDTNLTIKESLGTPSVPNAYEEMIEDLEQFNMLLDIGRARRKIGKNSINNSSSRSHSILQLRIIHKKKEEQKGYHESKMIFVDLAGSEKLDFRKSKNYRRASEGSNINKSLLALAKVIKFLTRQEKANYIPYRDSKLTRLLKGSLGGSSETALLTCVTLDTKQFEETLNTLNYANRAKKIPIELKKNFFVKKKCKFCSSVLKERNILNKSEKNKLENLRKKNKKLSDWVLSMKNCLEEEISVKEKISKLTNVNKEILYKIDNNRNSNSTK